MITDIKPLPPPAMITVPEMLRALADNIEKQGEAVEATATSIYGGRTVDPGGPFPETIPTGQQAIVIYLRDKRIGPGWLPREALKSLEQYLQH